jgi:hypothetical protein
VEGGGGDDTSCLLQAGDVRTDQVERLESHKTRLRFTSNIVVRSSAFAHLPSPRET